MNIIDTHSGDSPFILHSNLPPFWKDTIVTYPLDTTICILLPNGLTEKRQRNVGAGKRKQYPQSNGQPVCGVKGIARFRIETSTIFRNTILWLARQLNT